MPLLLKIEMKIKQLKIIADKKQIFYIVSMSQKRFMLLYEVFPKVNTILLKKDISVQLQALTRDVYLSR
jgi:hypothetical protein